jgi:DNA-binding transcriptional regulator YhcF (GntR family)
MTNVEDKRDYGAFIPSFLDDFRLDMASFRLYSHIARRAGSGLCWESIDNMAITCCMNRKTAYKAFQVLQDHKLILVEKRKGQTSLITLTSHSVWLPIPNQVQVEPIPNKVQPPIPDQVHKGTPSEGTPIKDLFLEGENKKIESKNLTQLDTQIIDSVSLPYDPTRERFENPYLRNQVEKVALDQGFLKYLITNQLNQSDRYKKNPANMAQAANYVRRGKREIDHGKFILDLHKDYLANQRTESEQIPDAQEVVKPMTQEQMQKMEIFREKNKKRKLENGNLRTV